MPVKTPNTEPGSGKKEVLHPGSAVNAPKSPPAPKSVPASEPVKASAKGRRGALVVSMAAVVVLGCGVLGGHYLVPLLTTPAEVPAVTSLSGEISDDGFSVVFSWQNPDFQEGDSYVWAEGALGEGLHTDMKEQEVNVVARNSEVCITVWVERGGQLSEGRDECVTVELPVVVHGPTDPVIISVDTWGSSGLDGEAFGPSLKDQYETLHPNVTIVLLSDTFSDMHEDLKTALRARSGAPTVALIDEDSLAGFVDQADNFVNLLDLGAAQYRDLYMPWKWDEATSADGQYTIGLGNDVAGLAMCYRSDLFRAAGLPYTRTAVEAAMGDTWEGFIDFGQDYVNATGRGFIDSATSVFWPNVQQLGTGHGFFDRDGSLDLDSVKPAFDTTLAVYTSGISAGAEPWSEDWNSGFSNGDFAVVLCPPWMLDIIESSIDTGSFGGQWDIADIPGPGGNWGGSFFTIPDQGSAYEQEQAYQFIEWLIQPEQQERIVAETGNVSAQPAVNNGSVIGALDRPFFNHAPYGQIFSKSAEDIPAGFSDPSSGDTIREAIEDVLNDVEAGSVSSASAWDKAVAKAEAAV